MTLSNDYPHSEPELLSLSEAGRLTGKPKAYLKELAVAGQLSVRLQQRDGESRIRVTRSGLAEAGLFPHEDIVIQPDQNSLSDLVSLVREQASRISALEEQRFQLGAQLGMAIERVATLEEQVSSFAQIEDLNAPREQTAIEHTGSNGTYPAKMPLALVVGAMNLKIVEGARSRFSSARARISGRSFSGRRV